MKLAYERIVYLRPDVAIVFATEQNFRLDVKRGVLKGLHRWKYEKEDYRREAIELITQQGSNYYPGVYNEEPWIHALREPTKVHPSFHTQYSKELFDKLDQYFEQKDHGENTVLMYPRMGMSLPKNLIALQ